MCLKNPKLGCKTGERYSRAVKNVRHFPHTLRAFPALFLGERAHRKYPGNSTCLLNCFVDGFTLKGQGTGGPSGLQREEREVCRG